MCHLVVPNVQIEGLRAFAQFLSNAGLGSDTLTWGTVLARRTQATTTAAGAINVAAVDAVAMAALRSAGQKAFTLKLIDVLTGKGSARANAAHNALLLGI